MTLGWGWGLGCRGGSGSGSEWRWGAECEGVTTYHDETALVPAMVKVGPQRRPLVLQRRCARVQVPCFRRGARGGRGQRKRGLSARPAHAPNQCGAGRGAKRTWCLRDVLRNVRVDVLSGFNVDLGRRRARLTRRFQLLTLTKLFTGQLRT